MKRLLYGIPAIALLVLFTISCEKSSETGINLKFEAATAPAMKALAVDGTLTFTEARMGVHEIEIEQENEDFDDGTETEVEVEYEGDYTIDLLTGTSAPEIGFADFIPGTYNKLKTELRPILNGNTASLVLKGSYTDAEMVTTQFEFSTAAEIEFMVESEVGFLLEEGSILDLVVAIDLEMLFNGVSFAEAVRNESDVVVIDDQTNTAIGSVIKANISIHAELEEDDD